MQNLLITGVTGVLGRDLVGRILQDEETRIRALVRPQEGKDVQASLNEVLYSGGDIAIGQLGRVQALAGDVAVPDLGIGEEVATRLRNDIDEIFHLAALTDLGAVRDDLFRANVTGTENVLKLAWDLYRHGRLKRLCYFSTAFVAGSRQDWCAPEDKVCRHPAWANDYEHSKFEAEARVRAAMADGLPVTIFRPSIVVGEAITGKTTKFNVIYPFVRLVIKGRLPVLAARPTDTLPVVPVDFVSRAAWAISQNPATIGRTHHLVSDNPPNLKSLLKVAHDAYPNLQKIRLISADNSVLGGISGAVLNAIGPNLGYLTHNLTFETKNTRAGLAGTGVEMPDTGPEFVQALLRFAAKSGYLS